MQSVPAAALRPWRTAGGVLLLTLLGVGGCGLSGTGQLELISLNLNAIDPPAPRTTALPMQRAYWWTDAAGKVQVVLSQRQRLPFRSEVFTYDVILTLDGLPAGQEREYALRAGALRTLARVGPARAQGRSIRGVAALYRAPHDRLRGSLRVLIDQEALLLLSWSSPSQRLLQGTFEAVHDAARGAALRAELETSTVAPTTQP